MKALVTSTCLCACTCAQHHGSHKHAKTRATEAYHVR